MTDLSPATRAVFEAFNSKFKWIEDGVPGPQFHAIAATIRALADQAHPKKHIEDIGYTHQNYVDGWKDALDMILAIATELEGTNGPA